MRRRSFLTGLALGTAGAANASETLVADAAAAGSTIDHLEFDSTASLLDGRGEKLTDGGRVAVHRDTSGNTSTRR